MADRRDDREQWWRRDPETERRIERRADIYRGSDERGYGGGERLGREWERGDPGGPERSRRGESLRSTDEERFDWGGRGVEERSPRQRGERRVRELGHEREVRRYSDYEREPPDHGYRELSRDDRRASPSGAFHDERREQRARPRGYGDRSRDLRDIGEVTDAEGRHRHYNLAGLHDMDDLSELRERYRERRRERDHEPRYGHGPGVENMEAPRVGYGTSMTRRDPSDRELGHGGFIGDTWRAGPQRPLGRAPKGYQRSDDRIREDICDRLMMSWMNAENVDILVRNGEVTLQGTVKSRDEKRAIEALAESVLGVKDISNALRVERGEQVRAEARPELGGEPMPPPQNLKDRPQAQERRGQAEERRAGDQEQTSVRPPGDTSLHS
ncbi:BON domain-containing protein [Hyalangium gracile]|uniref:BON domain-containing protein n=1 Tax=Hyalangium gracile TaxID=394092 RepID=UPI001CCDECF1|nr:BON domain-containing protein [Hyalangium gracile]